MVMDREKGSRFIRNVRAYCLSINHQRIRINVGKNRDRVQAHDAKDGPRIRYRSCDHLVAWFEAQSRQAGVNRGRARGAGNRMLRV